MNKAQIKIQNMQNDNKLNIEEMDHTKPVRYIKSHDLLMTVFTTTICSLSFHSRNYIKLQISNWNMISVCQVHIYFFFLYSCVKCI